MGFDTPEIIALLALAAFVAGFVDSIAGGGGLLTVPALLLAGATPVQALATNKLQGLFGAASATYTYASKGHVDVRSQWPGALLAFAASAIGAFTITQLPTDAIRPALPFLLIAVAAYFWLKPGLNDVDRIRRLSPLVFTLTIIPLIGFYDGVFGPGTGSFFMLAFVLLAGQGMLKATAHTKALNFASNVGGFVIFASAGAMLWKVGLIMGAAQLAGAQLGARVAIAGGAKIIRPLLVVVCVAMAVRLWTSG